ncbi:uncharacterized protein A1O9_12969 [Exophiala aquamarina CBS 119918]|uniref:Uncharacterized protein n=1 Tax=Exophiala aquamarina CBS 119918 TaxID=1182545 RepID=A0A072NTJ6_9EURO|nr:uncharacterized protein A1O9_12969 [Exophiala aquamarina CBS 119918]KEF50971.1 hypothetical protein A1O9_12969 [Exophiala aquamarina CBS 119918]
MSEPVGLTAIALVVSFTALIISVGQLLQSIFGTAEGFRRTNREVMGMFALSRDRVFHWAELRFETKFTTPHFTFHNPHNETSLLSKREDSECDHQGLSNKCILAIGNSGKRLEDLKALIDSSTNVSKLQRFLNTLDTAIRLDQQTLLPRSHVFSASWLVLLERLYEDEKKFNQREDGLSFIYSRPGIKGALLGPDHRQILFPAIESHLRSWDLLPPDAVRPFASISLGDLLTLCFRLRLTVQEMKPGQFSADGFGNSFSSLQIQGLGMIVQYRYDPSNDRADNVRHANTKFIPCESADKLAFSIIPGHNLLGLREDWPLMDGQNEHAFVDGIKTHFKDIGVSEQHLRKIKTHKREEMGDVWRTFGDSVPFLCPFMPVEGLGVVKYQPPFPMNFLNSTLAIREARILLRQRLNERLPALKDSTDFFTFVPSAAQSPATNQLQWVCLVLNFFEQKYRHIFHHRRDFNPLIGTNAFDAKAHDFLREVKSASDQVDGYLATQFNQPHSMPTYRYLVAAHHEMAITVHEEVNKQVRENPDNNKRNGPDKTGPEFRSAFSPGRGLHKILMEVLHRYIDLAMEKNTIVDSYREKTIGLVDSQGLQPATLSDDEIRTAWCTMILRAILWNMVHFPIWQSNLPYPSRYWKNNTLVLIA